MSHSSPDMSQEDALIEQQNEQVQEKQKEAREQKMQIIHGAAADGWDNNYD